MSDFVYEEFQISTSNFWYCLATVAGEVRGSNPKLVSKNRYYWNGTIRKILSKGQLRKLNAMDLELPHLVLELELRMKLFQK